MFHRFSFQRLSKSVLYRRFGKRIFDLTAAAVLLLVLVPVILLVAILIRLKLGSPILFAQQRPGKTGRIFSIKKFRSMTDGRDSTGNLLPDLERLTSFGQFLRSSSLDELPGLWNVLCGEMSLVGPRPLLVQYLERYSSEQSRRHEVRPGITGWAQVNGRNAINWEQKFGYDVWYVDHHTLGVDIRILFMTVAKVFARKDISAAGQATMPEFQGEAASPPVNGK